MKPNLTIPLEIKSLNDREFEGHGSTFGNVDLGGDVVMPGAFKRSLSAYRKRGKMPKMFWMHDPSKVPGKWLEMSEDDVGLRLKGTFVNTPLGNEIRELVTSGAIDSLSIGFQINEWDYDDDGNRLLKEIDLWEVSPVSIPMNPMAEITHSKTRLSAAGEYVPTRKEFEQKLREVFNLSRKVSGEIGYLVYSAKGDPGQPDEPTGNLEVEIVENDVEEVDDALVALKNLQDLLIARQIEDTFKRT